jgi:hypothetical protein
MPEPRPHPISVSECDARRLSLTAATGEGMFRRVPQGGRVRQKMSGMPTPVLDSALPGTRRYCSVVVLQAKSG